MEADSHLSITYFSKYKSGPVSLKEFWGRIEGQKESIPRLAKSIWCPSPQSCPIGVVSSPVPMTLWSLIKNWPAFGPEKPAQNVPLFQPLAISLPLSL